MTSTSSERRHFVRINFDADYKLSTASDEKVWQGKVVDLSLKGVLIDTPDDIKCHKGDLFTLELQISQNIINITSSVTIAHHDEQHIGLHIEHIDLESMTHLRRILELNLGDEHLLERELTEMLNLQTH